MTLQFAPLRGGTHPSYPDSGVAGNLKSSLLTMTTGFSFGPRRILFKHEEANSREQDNPEFFNSKIIIVYA